MEAYGLCFRRYHPGFRAKCFESFATHLVVTSVKFAVIRDTSNPCSTAVGAKKATNIAPNDGGKGDYHIVLLELSIFASEDLCPSIFLYFFGSRGYHPAASFLPYAADVRQDNLGFVLAVNEVSPGGVSVAPPHVLDRWPVKG